MKAKDFLKSKGFDDLREGLYHVFEQDEIELLLNEFAALPCSCEGGHYGYGAAKCFVCGRVKEVEKDGHFPADRRKAEKTTETKPDGYTLLGTGWVSIEEAQPKPQKRVYVVCENPKYGGGVVRFQTMAEYIPYMTVKEEDYMADEYQGDGDYNEEEDEYYTPEGFYEWQSEPEIHWKISAKVTHWMPLIALP